MKGFSYTGEKSPRFIPVCIFEGWLDSKLTHYPGNLYRHPVIKRLGWLFGYCCGLTRRALDAAKAAFKFAFFTDPPRK